MIFLPCVARHKLDKSHNVHSAKHHAISVISCGSQKVVCDKNSWPLTSSTFVPLPSPNTHSRSRLQVFSGGKKSRLAQRVRFFSTLPSIFMWSAWTL